MIKIGKWNHLKIVGSCEHGLLLDDGEEGTILMPQKYIYEGCDLGETAHVFVYPDSSDRLIATTETPRATVGEFAHLECVDTNRIGAFCNIGLTKDLLIPFSEQPAPMKQGYDYVVYIYLDPVSNRLVGSCKLHKYLDKESSRYFEDQEVEILVYEKNDLGYKVIVNHLDRGMIYNSEIFQDIRIGQQLSAYVYITRPDGKIDLCLQPPAEKKVTSLEERILAELKSKGGTLPLSDKSPAETIHSAFHCSKKTFKRALGALYKKKQILILEQEIQLTTS